MSLSPMNNHRHGMTLTEVLVASTLALLVVIGIGRVDMTRFYIGEEIRQRSAAAGVGQQEAALAALHLSKFLERADRVNLINTGQPGVHPFSGPLDEANIQLRIPQCPTAPPDAACFADAANYRWSQYARIGNELRFYEDTVSTCSNMRVLAHQLSSFTIAYLDTAPAPPGGEPLPGPPTPNPADNNMLGFTVAWDDGATPTPLTHAFRGAVAIRAGAYSDVNADCAGPTGPCDSGTALSPGGVSGPPLLCP